MVDEFLCDFGVVSERPRHTLSAQLLAMDAPKLEALRDTLTFLVDEVGLPRGKSGVERLLWRLPNLAGNVMRCEAVRARVQYLERSAGMSRPAIAQSLARTPSILNYKEATLESKVHALQGAGLSLAEIGQLVRTRPQLLTFSDARNLQPKLQWLRSCGFSPDQIRRILSRSAMLAANAERIEAMWAFLLTTGLSEEQARTVLTRHPSVFDSSVANNIEPKVRWLLDIGVAQHELPDVLYGCSPLLTLSLSNNLVPKLDVIIRELEPPMERLGSWLRFHNQLITCSLHARLLSRLRFLEHNGSRWSLVQRWSICKPTDAKFAQMADSSLDAFLAFRKRYLADHDLHEPSPDLFVPHLPRHFRLDTQHEHAPAATKPARAETGPAVGSHAHGGVKDAAHGGVEDAARDVADGAHDSSKG
eukprot:TRINITY_DN4561_c0_g1_i3.p1 TRINITY_DN4561_c0_g1~~TRINITY_DN4561_c0_g1_i3.p1  ORF type:complete len:427 (-),score=159.01 TRINITY_DN4561_c0_g1_i3:548-1801(-)